MMNSQRKSGMESFPAELEQAVRELAQFRYALRKFLRFSELAARKCGVTPQQHQLMLGVQGFTGRGAATISELAEFFQERHHSVVTLVERAVQSGLVVRAQDLADRRVVNVSLTGAGRKILLKLTRLHYDEAKQLRELWQTCELPSRHHIEKEPATTPRQSSRRGHARPMV